MIDSGQPRSSSSIQVWNHYHWPESARILPVVVDDVVQGNNLQSFDVLGMIGTVFRHAAEEIVYSPLSMFGYVLFGFAKSKLCVLIVPVLGVSFLIILYSETEYWRGIALLLVFVPMNILWIKDGSLITWCFMACYLGAILYCYRRICKIRELEW